MTQEKIEFLKRMTREQIPNMTQEQIEFLKRMTRELKKENKRLKEEKRLLSILIILDVVYISHQVY